MEKGEEGDEQMRMGPKGKVEELREEEVEVEEGGGR